ncbi:NAD(P)H-binding protein [Loigolactobacillus binensis]|uniref:NAD(P)H-binding protein n=1 Tax=Loigolactobacillus binensis TaxID=2559922 RepID=A0ABW3EB03_9LACO|nr:NAD(P)H-binding protein [Loigolactobacillus binensis]
MRHVLILGANGAIARLVRNNLKAQADMQLTLFLRNAQRITDVDPAKEKIVEGDVLDQAALDAAMAAQDIVYANLGGKADQAAANIIASMQKNKVRRLIFITSIGIYDEVPGKFGEWNNRMIGQSLAPYRKAAALIEQSDLDYTILRPAWLTNYDEVAYEKTQKGEPFKGTEISRQSVAAYVTAVINEPTLDVRASVGLDKPGTDGDKPSFY